MFSLRVTYILFISSLVFLLSCDSKTEKGDQLFAAGNYQEAIEAYSVYISDHPKDAKSFFNRGRAYEETGKLAEATEDFKTAYRLDNKNSDFLMSLGIIYFKQDEYDKTLGYMNELVKLNKNNHLALVMRGRAYFKLAEYRKAIENFSDAININANSGEAYLYRGVINAGVSNKKQEGCQDIQKAVSLNVDGAQSVLDKYCK